MTNPSVNAVRIGVGRGVTEFRQHLMKIDEQIFTLFWPGIILIVLFFQRDVAVPGSPLPLASLALPGVVGMLLAFNTLSTTAGYLGLEREDGTLLRSRAVPHGVAGYVAGQAVRIALVIVWSLAFVLIPGLLLFDGLSPGPTGWVTLLGIGALGLLATLPLGLVLGSVASPRAVGGWLFLISGGLIAVSGIFYPLAALPGWLQVIGQGFPYYWLGLGVRSAMLPDAAAALEIGGTWRHLETVGVLGAWAVIGLVLAPVVLRRVARRQSGAAVAASREKAMQRTY